MAQELLPLEHGAINAKTVSEAIGKPLKSFLLTASSARDAAERIDPLMLAEARERARDVARMAGPMGREAVYVALQPLIVLFGRPDFGTGEAAKQLTKSWVEIYGEALEKLPAEALAEGVSRWIMEGKWFPKPAELLKLSDPKASELRIIAWRLKVAVETADKAKPVIESPEERERGRRMAAEDLARRSLRRMPGSIPASKPADVAERLRAMA